MKAIMRTVMLIGLFAYTGLCMSNERANSSRADFEQHLRSQMQSVRRKISDLEEHNKQLITQNSTLQEQLATRTEEVKNLQTSSASTNKNNEFLQKKVSELERWLGSYERVSNEMWN